MDLMDFHALYDDLTKRFFPTNRDQVSTYILSMLVRTEGFDVEWIRGAKTEYELPSRSEKTQKHVLKTKNRRMTVADLDTVIWIQRNVTGKWAIEYRHRYGGYSIVSFSSEKDAALFAIVFDCEPWSV